MKKITPGVSTLMIFFMIAHWILSFWVAHKVSIDLLYIEHYSWLVFILTFLMFFWIYIFITYHIFMKLFPRTPGTIKPGSKKEIINFIYIVYDIFYFLMLTNLGIIPMPLSRLLYKALGIKKIGENTYPAGRILDPQFVEIGSNTIIGGNSLIMPHSFEGPETAYENIRIGNNVVIGVNAIITPGVTIEDGAIIGAMAFVNKGSHIKANEIWVGNPAKFLKMKDLLK